MKSTETPTREIDAIPGIEYDKEREIYIIADKTREHMDWWSQLDEGYGDDYGLTLQDKQRGAPRNYEGAQEEIRRRNIERVQRVIDTANLSPRDQEKLEVVILRLRLGYDVDLSQLHLNIFSK